MKTILKTTIIILIITTTLFSCNKNNNEEETGNQTTFYMTAKVDGQDFIANKDATVSEFIGIVTGDEIRGVYQIDIDNYEHIRFEIIEYDDSLGTFNIGPGLRSMSYQINTNGWSAYYSQATGSSQGSGSVVITVNDNTHIEGTFSGTLINPTNNTQKVITEGKFSAKKQ